MQTSKLTVKAFEVEALNLALREKFGDQVTVEVMQAPTGLGQTSKLGNVDLLEIVISAAVALSLDEVIAFAKHKLKEYREEKDKDDEK